MPGMIELVNADATGIPLASQSVHLVVTSPPYFGLRKYDAGPGEIGSEVRHDCGAWNRRTIVGGRPEVVPDGQGGWFLQGEEGKPLEYGPPEPGCGECFICAMRAFGREIWRVLRNDGVLILNLGDSYNGSGGAGGDYGPGGLKEGQPRYPGRNVPELQVGDLLNMPHRVAGALQADGWIWRRTMIWNKGEGEEYLEELPMFDLPVPKKKKGGAAMPESVNGWRWERHRIKIAKQKRGENHAGTRRGNQSSPPHPNNGIKGEPAKFKDCPGCEKCRDTGGWVWKRGSWRPTSAHEYIFLLVKENGYFADREAVRVPLKASSLARINQNGFADQTGGVKDYGNGINRSRSMRNTLEGFAANPTDANPRDVLTFKPTPWKGEHFATFPVTLPAFFIKAFTSEGGVCADCGQPWARVVNYKFQASSDVRYREGEGTKRKSDLVKDGRDEYPRGVTLAETLGFRRTCSHADAPAVPAIVLDPFFGSGSTGAAAAELGRSAIGLDLSFEYLVRQARERLGHNALRSWAAGRGRKVVAELDDLPMFPKEKEDAEAEAKPVR